MRCYRACKYEVTVHWDLIELLLVLKVFVFVSLHPDNSSYSFHQIVLKLGQLDHEVVQCILFWGYSTPNFDSYYTFKGFHPNGLKHDWNSFLKIVQAGFHFQFTPTFHLIKLLFVGQREDGENCSQDTVHQFHILSRVTVHKIFILIRAFFLQMQLFTLVYSSNIGAASSSHGGLQFKRTISNTAIFFMCFVTLQTGGVSCNVCNAFIYYYYVL